MALKKPSNLDKQKKKIDERTAKREANKERDAGKQAASGTRTFSRPTGTDASQNIETTNLSKEEAKKVSKESGQIGLAIAEKERIKSERDAQFATPDVKRLQELANTGALTSQVLDSQEIGAKVGEAPRVLTKIAEQVGGRLTAEQILGQSPQQLPGTSEQSLIPGLNNPPGLIPAVTDVGGVMVPDEVVKVEEIKKVAVKVVQDRLDDNSNKVTSVSSAITKNMLGKLAGGFPLLNLRGVDKQLQNIEGSLINHKEGASDVTRLVLSQAYTPEQGIEDLNNMEQDINLAEKTMQELAIASPAVFAEAKGYEFQTRLQKIRRSILSRKQEVINIAATGRPVPDSSQLALLSDDLASRGIV